MDASMREEGERTVDENGQSLSGGAHRRCLAQLCLPAVCNEAIHCDERVCGARVTRCSGRMRQTWGMGAG